MKQILHIFRKDLRHNWPEVGVSLALLIAYVADQPRQWSHAPAATRFLEVASKAVPVLLVISWAYLIIRLVQEESLVGDRQFWITRPYEWPKLLGAKLLEIFVLIHVPFFLAQVLLLKMAHFPVTGNLAGLLGVQFTFALVFSMGMVIGVLTPGIGTAVLVVLGGFVVLIGMIAVDANVPDAQVGSSGAIGTAQFITFFGSCVAIVLLQYAKRKTVWSWIWIGCAAIAITLLFLVIPYGKLVEKQFPVDKNKPVPAEFAFQTTGNLEEKESLPENYTRPVFVKFPLHISGIPANTVINIRAQRLDIETEQGEKWTSNWNPDYSSVLVHGEKGRYISFLLKPEVWKRFAMKQVKARLHLALNIAELKDTKTVTHPVSGFDVPGGGKCQSSLDGTTYYCESAMELKSGVYVHSDSATADCPGARVDNSLENDDRPAGEFPASFVQFDAGGDGDPTLSPIHETTVSLRFLQGAAGEMGSGTVCAVSELQISAVHNEFNSRVDVELGKVALKNYVLNFSRNGARRSGRN